MAAPLLIGVVFFIMFLIVTFLLVAGGSGGDQEKKVAATLDSALASYRSDSSDQLVDLRKNELLSAVPLLNRLLIKIELASRIRTLLYQADLKWTAGALMLMSAVCFVIPASLVYLRVGNPFFAMLVGFLGACGPIAFVLNKRRSRFNLFEQRLPEALDLMVSALRAGHSLVAALRLVAYESPEPIQSEFRICYDEQNYGLELRTAMDNLITRVPLQDLKIVMVAILIQKESGGNLAEVLDKVTYVIRERFRLKRQVRTHTAQGRLTGWILSFLPIVLGMALYLVNPKTMSLLWTTPIGVKLMITAGIMVLVGAYIIRRIVNMEV